MKLKILILFLFSLFFVVDVFGYRDTWSAFKKQFGKKYNPVEDNRRKQIFLENVLKIKNHNMQYAVGLVSYKKAIYEFADLQPDEMSGITYTGLANKKISKQLKGMKYADDNSLEGTKAPIDHRPIVPKSIDWREKGAVTDVKDQNGCYSCWAFSAVGVIEGQRAIRHGILESLSEQQIVDCMEFYCEDGGYVSSAFNYIEENGLMTSQDYPYRGNKSVCKVTNKSHRVFIYGHEEIEESSEAALKSAVGLIGPVSVSLQMDSIRDYKEGIFDDYCFNTLNHVALVVGYDKDEKTGIDYWIIKNSWGTDWGENGYLRLRRGKNLCGINEEPTYANIVYRKHSETLYQKIKTICYDSIVFVLDFFSLFL